MRARIYILETNSKDEKIVLSTDEISSVKLSNQPSANIEANIVSELVVTVEGDILSKLNANSINDLKMVQDLKEYKEKEYELSNVWSESKYEIASKTKDLIKRKYSYINIENITLENIYKLNKENVLGLKKWAFSYNEESDYRDIIVEYIYDNDEVVLYIFPGMFAYLYEEECSIKSGNGHFKVGFKQKIGQEKGNEFIQ